MRATPHPETDAPDWAAIAGELIQARQTVLPKRLVAPGPDAAQQQAILAAAAAAPDVVDVHPQAGMPLGDAAEDLDVGAGGEQAHDQPRLLRRLPEPVERAVGPPGFLVRLVEGEAETEHARALAPVGDDLLAIRALEIEMPEDAEFVRVLAHRLDGVSVDRFSKRAGRMDHGAIDPGRGHLGERIFNGIGRNLAMVRAHLAVAPDVDLRIDDQHHFSLW